MAYYFINIEEQLHSVLDALTKAAVSEIGRLIEDAATGLRLEIIRSHKENETLSMKLQEKERELRAVQGDRMQTDEVKDAFERNYSLLSVEKDIRQCVVAQQTDEVLNQVLVKKEQVEVEEDLKSDWKSDIFEAEESSGAGSVPGLKQDGAPAAEAGLQPGLVMDLGQVGWSEPVEQEGDVGSDGQVVMLKVKLKSTGRNSTANGDGDLIQPSTEQTGRSKRKHTEYMRRYREKKLEYNEKCKERMRRYRARLKEKALSTPCPASEAAGDSRSAEEKKKEKRIKAALRKRAERARQNPEKRQRIREKDAAYRRRKRENKKEKKRKSPEATSPDRGHELL